ncbi:hypothetical protein [Staphylococcus hsinchuensis]|uniref:Lipase n=1 Tax=Staphylococcus hsinchuensis TaxID=3051183 RepID=A0ABZ3EET7_9STAP
MDESAAFTAAVKKKYPNSKFYGSGHSLGGYLAQYNGVKYDFENTTTFAAPNPNGAFSADVQKDIDQGVYDDKIKNIGHDFDIVNSLTFFQPRIGKDVKTPYTADDSVSLFPFIKQHLINTYNQFDKEGNAIEMSDAEIKQDRQKFRNTLLKKMLSTSLFSISPNALFMSRAMAYFKKLTQQDEGSETKNDAYAFYNEVINVLGNGGTKSSVSIGSGGARGSGREIKILIEGVRELVEMLRSHRYLYDEVMHGFEQFEENTGRKAERILDKYESELRSGSHEYITPGDLERYMKRLSQSGSAGSWRFHNHRLMEDAKQEVEHNHKNLMEFAEKLDYVVDQFVEKDIETSGRFGLF